ncbi:uncharacterized protein LOC124276429 isoform X2 [Haliotis rubra]|uniref:uncharacterized protein LOC124276429 isoform X2 n=1 Tax=Haliotis rubra TaxID=36100 RepID=UPI001EE4FB2B|nr:uncharacterized protein LOC124276429 isoform X2 [Haliotis rubra]
MILCWLSLLMFTSLPSTRAACASLESVVHVCSDETAAGSVVFLDTSLTYAMTGSCRCILDGRPVPMGINISVESIAEQCESVLNFPSINYDVTCGQVPGSVVTNLTGNMNITWTKRNAFKSTDTCIRIAKSQQSTAGNLSLQCEKGGDFKKTTGDSPLKSHFTTTKPEETHQTTISPQTAAAIRKRFVSNITVGILSGIIITLFLIGLVVHFSDKRLKERLLREEEEARLRRMAKMNAIHRLYPPRRREVVETTI